MFDLEKREKWIVILLTAALLTGSAIIFWRKSAPSVDIKIRSFSHPISTATYEKIDINTASKEALMELPGVGESLAVRIIDYRNRSGSFSSVEDIRKVKGIKEGLFNKIKDSIRVE